MWTTMLKVALVQAVYRGSTAIAHVMSCHRLPFMAHWLDDAVVQCTIIPRATAHCLVCTKAMR